MKSQWITHKEKQIWVLDYSDFRKDTQGFIAEAQEAHKVLMKQPPLSTLVLVDIHNTVANMDVVALLKRLSAEAQKNIIKIATVGLSSEILQVLYRAVITASGLKNAAVFSDNEKAKDWLVEA